MYRALLPFLALSIVSLVNITRADETVGERVAADVAGLLDTLTKGLEARRPSEFAFLNKVVSYVEQNKISRKMVLSTFHWARRKAGRRRDSWRKYPYPYFERAIKIRAAKIGVKL